MKHNNKQTYKADKATLLRFFARGQFAEAEILLRNNAQLRKVLLYLPGLRHTKFFKNRIRFYKEYARAHGMVRKLRCQDRQKLRHAFAQSHCTVNGIKRAARIALQTLQREDASPHPIQSYGNKRPRKKILGLF